MIPDVKGADEHFRYCNLFAQKKKQMKVIENGMEYNRNNWIQNQNSIIISAIISGFLEK